MNFNFNFIFGYVMENSWKVWIPYMEISTTELFWEEAPPEFGNDRRHSIAKEKNTNSHILKGNPDC